MNFLCENVSQIKECNDNKTITISFKHIYGLSKTKNNSMQEE